MLLFTNKTLRIQNTFTSDQLTLFELPLTHCPINQFGKLLEFCDKFGSSSTQNYRMVSKLIVIYPNTLELCYGIIRYRNLPARTDHLSQIHHVQVSSQTVSYFLMISPGWVQTKKNQRNSGL